MILLIYPPFSNPFVPSLGPAYIKSYIENNSKHKLHFYDFNIKLHKKIFDSIKKADTFFKTNLSEIKFDKEKLIESISFLKKNKIRSDQFRKFANDFHKNTMKIYTYFDKKIIELTKQNQFDRLDHYFKDIFNFIKKNNVKVVCFSHLFNQQIFLSTYLARRLKEKFGVITIFGGHPLSHSKEEYVEKTEIDFIIYNDGEESLLKLLDLIKDHNYDLNAIKQNANLIDNIMYFNNGKLISGKSKKFDINTQVIPDYSDLNLNDYLTPSKVISLVLGRGCFWNQCSFCTSPIHTDQFRMRTIETFVDEIEEIHNKYGVDYFTFEDEMIIPSVMKKIATEILERDLKIKYTFLAKPSKLKIWDFKILKKSGCISIYWGVETGNQRMSDLMQKGTDVVEIKQILKNAHESGIKNYTFIMLGFPGETKESFLDTVDLIKQDYIDSISVSTFGLQKDTDAYNNPKKYGIKIITNERTILSDSFDFEYIKKSKGVLNRDELNQLKKEYSPLFNSKNKWTDKVNLFRNHILILS